MVDGADTPTSAPGGPTLPSPDDRALERHRSALLVAAALTIVVFALSWYRHASFHSTTLDLAVYDQAVWKLAHFQAPVVTTIGWNAFADHLSPVLFLFAPLYRVAATPMWLFAAQAVALGVGYLAVGPTLRAAGAPRHLLGPFRVAYVACPLLWNAALFDFHPTTLAVPFLFVGVRAALRHDRRAMVLCTIALFALRDDLGLAVAALALVGFREATPAERRFRMVLVAVGLGWMILGGALASLLGSDRHWVFHYGYVASTPGDALSHPLRSAIRVVQGLWRADNLGFALGLLFPLGFLPILRPARFALALLPALPLLTSAGEQFHSVQFHYGAGLFPFLVVAAVPASPTGFISRWPRAPVWLSAMALASLVTLGPPSTGELTRPAPRAADARRALALVRDSDAVVATTNLGPHLAHRETLLMFPFPFAPAVADFPLPARATEVSAAAAARIDAVVIGLPQVGLPDSVVTEFMRSPYLAEFQFRQRFGRVFVYRRTAPS